MCVGVPEKVIEIKEKKAQIEQGGHFHWVDISPLDQDVKVGDYLITYQDVAVNRISAKEAEEVIALMDSAGDAGVKSSD